MSDHELRGRRLPDAVLGEAGPGWDAWKERQPGDYMRVASDGLVTWWICDPLGHVGQIGGRRIHLERLGDSDDLVPVLQPPIVKPWQITEHEDGTITVEPSILDAKPGGWHGYLRGGVWTDA